MGHSAEFMRHLVEVQVCFETSALTVLRNLVVFGVLWCKPSPSANVSPMHFKMGMPFEFVSLWTSNCFRCAPEQIHVPAPLWH
jgi:hypothetical protein